MIIERTAHIVLLNERNQILTLQIGAHKIDPKRSHTLDLPGGIIEVGDNSERDGVIREVREETGVELSTMQVELCYAKEVVIPDENKQVIRLMYGARLGYTPEVTLSWEHEAYHWAEFELALEMYAGRLFFHEAIAYIQENKII